MLLFPAAAQAKPTLSPEPCATSTPLNSGVVDKPASGKPISLDFELASCSSQTQTLTTSVVGTATTWVSTDPLESLQCSTAPYSSQTVTLRAGDKKRITAAAQLPYCGYSLWGVTLAYDVEYVATTSLDGVPLVTASSWVIHRGGV